MKSKQRKEDDNSLVNQFLTKPPTDACGIGGGMLEPCCCHIGAGIGVGAGTDQTGGGGWFISMIGCWLIAAVLPRTLMAV